MNEIDAKFDAWFKSTKMPESMFFLYRSIWDAGYQAGHEKGYEIGAEETERNMQENA